MKLFLRILFYVAVCPLEVLVIVAILEWYWRRVRRKNDAAQAAAIHQG